MASNREVNISVPIKGINLDASPQTLDAKQAYTFALNARQESEDGNQFYLSNEASTTLSLKFKEGWIVIGHRNIEDIETIYMLYNVITGLSEIGTIKNDTSGCIDNIDNIEDVSNPCIECNKTYKYPINTGESLKLSTNPCQKYETIKADMCLNFSPHHPIHKIDYEITNQTIKIYWTDNYNPPRWMDLNNIPLLEDGSLDCNQIKIFPYFKVPKVYIESVKDNGALQSGAYQILFAYANSKGEELSQYYSATNPASIWDNVPTTNLIYNTNKSLNITVSNIDTTYRYFNLVVAKTIGSVTEFRLIDTLDILTDTYSYLYTGSNKTERIFTTAEIFYQSPIYIKAETLESQNNILMMGGLHTEEVVNYQQIANNIKLYWQTYRLPYNDFEGYNEGSNSANYRGYLRDEVYTFEFVPVLRSGRIGNRFHIPGRKGISSDYELINNKDSDSNKNNPCETVEPIYRWKIYNTATRLGYSQEWLEATNKSCYIGPYEYGEFAYNESIRKIPNNTKLWYSIANDNIRHHRFPDENITKRYSIENNIAFIYPIGVKVDAKSVYDAIQSSDLTQSQKDDIIGFKIVRGNRRNNESVIARGLLNNIGKYKDDDEQDYYFANYPFNDIRKDPFFATELPVPNKGLQANLMLDAFKDQSESKSNYIFYGPNTLFYKPNVGTGLQLKLETVEIGEASGHFVQVEKNAKSKFLTADAFKASAAIGAAMALDFSKGGVPKFNGTDAIATFESTRQLFERLIPFENFGYTFNSVGIYNKSFPIPNDGNKQRFVSYSRYVTDGLNQINDGKRLNHFSREGGVFLNTTDTLPYTHEVDLTIPQDKSRYIPYTYLDTEDSNISLQDFFNLIHTDIVAQASLGYSVQQNSQSLSSGSTNLNNILSVITSGIIQKYIDSNDYNGLVELDTLENSWDPLNSTVYGQYDINFPGTQPVTTGSSPYKIGIDGSNAIGTISPILPFDQAYKEYVEVDDVLQLSDVTIKQLSYFPVSLVNPKDKFLFYYYIDQDDQTRDDCEGNNWLDNLDTCFAQGVSGAAQTVYIQSLINNYCDSGGFTGCNQYGFDHNATYTAHTSTFTYSTKTDKYFNTKNIFWGELLYNAYKSFETALDIYNIYKKGELPLVTLSNIRKAPISSYYASIKRVNESQYEGIYSYQSVDTGYYQLLKDEQGNRYSEFDTVFGGDTYINRFALKIKNPIYRQNLVGFPDGSDTFYDEYGNYGYSMFWVSSKPISFKYKLNQKNLGIAFKGIGLVNTTQLVGSVLVTVGEIVIAIGAGLSVSIVGSIAGVIVIAVGAVIYLVGKLFSNLGNKIIKAAISLYRDLLQQVIDTIGVKNNNMDLATIDGIANRGAYYMFVYGVPYFFVESDVNVDMRQAGNNLDQNFYPNVGNDIPDSWLQEANVSIAKDNFYLYNRDFSKQNVETNFKSLDRDFDPDKINQDYFSSRVIYSETSSLEDKQNNWLVYKANNYYDFPLTNGKLVDLNALEQGKVLARFEDNVSVYNAFVQINTDNKTAIVGTGSMFSTPPQEFSNASLGYLGTQHKAFCSTKYGYFWVDAKRGEIFQLGNNNSGLQEISKKGMSNWFKENLPFNLLRYFPNISLDNSFTSIGISIVWDSRFERLFITKKDYIPKFNTIKYDDNTSLFTINDIQISLSDTQYFEDASWTIGYSPKTESWVSWYSFIPDYYIEHNGYFQSGLNGTTSTLWNHNLTNKSYQIFYNNLYPFEVECITNTDIQSKTLQSVQYRLDVLRYTNAHDYKLMNNISFDQAEIFNTLQTSGTLNLSLNNTKDLFQDTKVINTDSVTVKLSKVDDIHKFNQFYDITKDNNSNESLHEFDASNVYRELNPDAIDYNRVKDVFTAKRLKSDWFKVKLSNFKQSRYKYIFKLLWEKTIKSIR